MELWHTLSLPYKHRPMAKVIKSKTPTIVSYKTLYEEFSHNLTFKPAMKTLGTTSKISLGDDKLNLLKEVNEIFATENSEKEVSWNEFSKNLMSSYKALDNSNVSDNKMDLELSLLRILKTLDKHKEALDEIEESILDFIHKSIRRNPPVYIAKTRDVKTDKVYFTAKTFIPTAGGGKKEVKVYLGNADNFDNDTKSAKAKSEAVKLIRAAIEAKSKAGEFK